MQMYILTCGDAILYMEAWSLNELQDYFNQQVDYIVASNDRMITPMRDMSTPQPGNYRVVLVDPNEPKVEYKYVHDYDFEPDRFYCSCCRRHG